MYIYLATCKILFGVFLKRILSTTAKFGELTSLEVKSTSFSVVIPEELVDIFFKKNSVK